MTRASKEPRRPAPAFRADELIADLLDRDPRVEAILASFGLPCSGCVVKDTETLAEGCVPLGLRTEDVLARLNALEPPADHRA
jgi:hybrid cluster-associated redox disulfide protein